MYKSFTDIEALKQWVVEDKQAKGVGASTLDRYPIRFVLFDNFSECYEFVEFLQSDCGAHVESVDRWIDTNYPDILLTYVELGERICEHSDFSRVSRNGRAERTSPPGAFSFRSLQTCSSCAPPFL